MDTLPEKEEFLCQQLITCLGNKRSLLGFIGEGIGIIQKRLGKDTLKMFDVFSGSGIVARYFKRFSELLIVNDLEQYARVINECYLSNEDERDMPLMLRQYNELIEEANKNKTRGIISELYAPRDGHNIQAGERVFFTPRNAVYIDTIRQLIARLPQKEQKYFLAPLLSQVSIHTNTAGVFKGFYKNRETGIGHFGGRNQNALARITGDITLPFPVFSNFNCETLVCCGDSNTLCKTLPEVDIAYADPPYNQHPYGSNYFMLNLILDYQYPEKISKVSGIPENWNRSDYNKGSKALETMAGLVQDLNAKYVMISFNSEGFITVEQMRAMLNRTGKVEMLETKYNTFRGSRNLKAREIHVREYLFLLEK